MVEEALQLRKIKPEDNRAVAELVKSVMATFDCVGEGYSSSDSELDDMFGAYNQDQSVFYVIADEQCILGCGGIAPLAGGDSGTCELKKMYFYSELRGKGFGKKLMELLLQEAKQLGFNECYLETVERMETANYLYARFGFQKLSTNEGSTGHCGCDSYYQRTL